jgi:hypothetical protein
MLTWNLRGKIVEIETAYLRETIYMETVKRMEANENEYLLKKSAREIYKKLVLVLKRCGFQANSVNLCLWTE